MKKLVAVFYLALPAAFLSGQTASPGGAAVPIKNLLQERLDLSTKRFPPEMVAPTKDLDPVKVSRSFCVYPSLEKGSLSFKKCRTTPHWLRLIPPIAIKTPAAKP